MPVLLGEPESPGHPLLCPGCGEQWVHGGKLHEQHVTDGYTCPLGTRGSWLSSDFSCEICDTRWRLIVGFHKGQTFLGYVVDIERNGD